MAQDWNNTADSNPQQEPGKQQTPASTYQPQTASSGGSGRNKRSVTWIYAAIIALLLATCIVLFLKNNRTTEQLDVAKTKADSAMSTRDALNAEYQAAITRLDQLNTTNSQLNNEIKDKDGSLQQLRSQLQALMKKENRTEAEVKKAKALIAELNQKIAGYEARIAELEGENKALTEQNTSLTQEKEQVQSENTGLQEKVRLGAVLHASNIRMEAINLKRNGSKEAGTSKAKKTDMLRVIFDIDENRITESGTKELLLRITAPDGRLLSNAAYGSGVTTADDGQQLSYTIAKQVNLTNNTPVRNVSVDWNQESAYQRGTYAIEIYNSGFRIGGGSVELK